MNLSSFKNLNVKNKIAFNVILFLLVNAIIIYFIMIPSINRIKNLRVTIMTEKINLEKKTAKERNINLLSDKFDKIEPQLEKFEKIFINTNRELEFITTLEGIAKKNNTSQKIDLDLSKAQNEQIYKKIPLALSVQGEFQNVVKYLTDLESLSYYLNIDLLEISSAKSSGSSFLSTKTDLIGQPTGNVNLKITANTYWQ